MIKKFLQRVPSVKLNNSNSSIQNNGRRRDILGVPIEADQVVGKGGRPFFATPTLAGRSNRSSIRYPFSNSWTIIFS